MKKTLLSAIFFSAALSSFALTMTHTLDFGGTQNILIADSVAYGNMMIDIGYRFTACPQDVGFYTGADVTFGIPTLTIWSTDFDIVDLESRTFHVTWDPPENFFTGIKVPFGYRWEDSFIKNMGVYLGGGPATQFIVTDSGLTSAIGLFGEFGFQTNKTENVGFHLGLQWGTYPLIYTSDWNYLDNSWGFESTIQLGMSWRRVKK